MARWGDEAAREKTLPHLPHLPHLPQSFSLILKFVSLTKSESAFVILNFELISPSSHNLGLAAILISSSFPGSPISLAFS